MGEVLGGLAVFGAVIAVGWGLGRAGALPRDADRILTRLAFFAATPALLVTTLADAELGAVLSARTLSAVVAEVVAVLGAFAVHRGLLRRELPEAVIGALASAYVNAANLGIPVAVLVIGDATAIAPILLLQLLILTPAAFAVLDTTTRRLAASPLRRAAAPLRNPLVLAVLGGVALNLTGVPLDAVAAGHVREILDLLGRMAVPLMMISLGLSLADARRSRRGGRRAAPASAGQERALWWAVGWKLVAAPVIAAGLGAVLGLRGVGLLVPVTMACLPTAQNVFMYASRYERAVPLARDAVLLTTAGFVPIVLLASALLR